MDGYVYVATNSEVLQTMRLSVIYPTAGMIAYCLLCNKLMRVQGLMHEICTNRIHAS